MYRETVHKADLQNGYYMNPILDGDYRQSCARE